MTAGAGDAPGTRGAITSLRANLREPAFRQLWWSQLAGNLADAMAPVILTLLVLASPHRGQLGAVLALDGICFVAGLTLGSRLGGRGSTVAGLRTAHLTRAAGVVPLGLVLLTGSGEPLAVLVVFAVVSSGPAGVSQTLAGIRIAEIRPEDERAGANGLRAAGQNAAFGLAPVVVVAGVAADGHPRFALVALVAVAAVAAVLGCLPAGAAVAVPDRAARPSGVLRVLRNPYVLLLLLQGTVLVLAARGPGKVLGLIHLHDIGAYRLLAFVSLAQFTGAVAGSLLAIRLSAGLGTGVAAVCFVGCALPLVALAARWPGPALLLAFVTAGVAYATYLVGLATSVQNATDVAGLGAVYSAQGLIWWAADPLGLFVIGEAAGAYDVRTVALGTLALLAVSGLVVVPLTRRYRPGGGEACASP